jgi:hypothetical protein
LASGTVSSVFSVPKTDRVEYAALEGLKDLDDKADDGVGREVLTTALALLRGEVGEKVLVDEAEGVTLELGGQRSEEPQELDQGRALQLLIATRQDVLELGVGFLDSLDGLVGGLPMSSPSGRSTRVDSRDPSGT